MVHVTKDNRNRILAALLTVLGACGFYYVESLVQSDKIPYDFLPVLIFIPLYLFNLKTIQTVKEKAPSAKGVLFTGLFSFFFSAFLVVGAQLKRFGMTYSGYKGKLVILLMAVLLGCFCFPFFYYLFSATVTSVKERPVVHLKRKFFIAWLFIFACYFVMFLAYYPAIMAYDFHRQSQEAVRGFAFFYPYQPLVHTWLYWLFFKIGGLFGSLETGMAFYSIFQMLVLSSVCSYAAVMTYRLSKRKLLFFLSLAFFGVFPFFCVMAVEATKDVLFTALFLLFILLFIEMVLFKKADSIGINICWIAVGTLMVLFRNNAIYGLIPFLAVYVILSKGKRLKVLGLAVVLLAVSLGMKALMPHIIGTKIKAPEIEKYSVIIQSMGRVGYYHANELDAETYELINGVIPDEYWKYYNPPISDSIKGWVPYNDLWDGNMKDVLAAWIKVGLKYPNEYIDSFLLTNAGYLFLDDETWANMLGEGTETRYGAIFTYNSSTSDVIPDGISHESKLPGVESAVEEVVSANAFLHWPLISVIFRPAFYSWGLFMGLLLFIRRKALSETMVVLFPFLYYATLLLGPCVSWRYIFPIAAFFPIPVALWCNVAGGGETSEPKEE